MSAPGSEHSVGQSDSLPGSESGRATLAAGSKAMYPGQGPCRIAQVVERVVNERVVLFYHLIILDDSAADLYVPVEKAGSIGLRLLIKKSEIPRLLAHLQESAKAPDNWKDRLQDNAKRFNSGSPFDLAEIVASLTELSETRSLTIGDGRTLEKAKRLLICEISEVMEESRETVEELVDKALHERTKSGNLIDPSWQ